MTLHRAIASLAFVPPPTLPPCTAGQRSVATYSCNAICQGINRRFPAHGLQRLPETALLETARCHVWWCRSDMGSDAGGQR